MAFCQKCGAPVQDGIQFCPTCGANLYAGAGDMNAPAQSYQAPQQQQYRQAPPVNDVDANKGMAVLAYFIFFIPLIAGTHKTSPYVKFHTNQGTLLFIFAAAWSIVLGIIMAIISAILVSAYLFAVWTIISLILSLLYLVPLVLLIVGVVNAVGGKTKPLPVIGNLFTIIK